MSNRFCVLTIVAGCVAVSACVTSPTQAVNREDLLATAGFQVIPADTPERTEALNHKPSNKLVQRVRDGSTHYIYADPLVCGCVYVGDAAAYERYRGVLQQRRLAQAEVVKAEERNGQADRFWDQAFF